MNGFLQTDLMKNYHFYKLKVQRAAARANYESATTPKGSPDALLFAINVTTGKLHSPPRP